MKELNEMTIGRTDDPENPFRVSAFKAAGLFGAGSRNPSGPAVMMPRQQAGHMIAVDRPSKFSLSLLNPRGRPHKDSKADGLYGCNRERHVAQRKTKSASNGTRLPNAITLAPIVPSA